MIRVVLVLMVALVFTSKANALQTFDYGNLSAMTDSAVTDLVKTVAIGADHHAYMPASPLGAVIGFDLGLEATAIAIPDSFKTAMTLAGVSGSIPSLIPLPKLNIHKGLPWGIDLGFSYFGYQNYLIIAGEIKWAFLKGLGPLPAVAVRASESLTRLFFMRTRTYTVDVVASTKLAMMFEPYLGVGVQIASGELSVPLGGSTGLPLTLSGNKSMTHPHIYIGLPIKMMIVRLTGEYQYSFAGVSTYGAKFSLSF